MTHTLIKPQPPRALGLRLSASEQPHPGPQEPRRTATPASDGRARRQAGLAGVADHPARPGQRSVRQLAARSRPTCTGCLEAIVTGKAGLVAARELSRLVRDNQDWSHLVRLCRFEHVLLADEHRIYDPADPQDRMVLGIQGAFNEFELSMILERMQQSLRAEGPSAANNMTPCRQATSAAIRPCARSTRINECSAPSRRSCTTSSGSPAPASYTCICSMKCSNYRW